MEGWMDIDVLKSLVSVAETGSFSRAATTLCISQSAVSKRVKMLEDKLGLPLLDRSGPLLQLTPAGRIVEKNARAILDVCSRCTLELGGLKGEKRISFRCTPSYGISCLPSVTKALMEQRPDIANFTLAFDNLDVVLESVRNGSCQLAVVEHCDFIPISDEHLLEHLEDDFLVLVGSPALGISTSETRLSELLSHTLYVRSSGCCSRQILEYKMKQAGLSLDSFKNVLVCDDLNMILKLLVDGYGIGYMAKSVVTDYLIAGTLQMYDLPEFEQRFHRSLLVGSGFVETEESNDLIRIIRSVAGTSLALAISYLSPFLFESTVF